MVIVYIKDIVQARTRMVAIWSGEKWKVRNWNLHFKVEPIDMFRYIGCRREETRSIKDDSKVLVPNNDSNCCWDREGVVWEWKISRVLFWPCWVWAVH